MQKNKELQEYAPYIASGWLNLSGGSNREKNNAVRTIRMELLNDYFP